MSIQNSDNEKALLQQVAEGNERAFRQLFEIHHHKLGDYILRLTHTFPFAGEIVQEVFIKIWVNRKALATVENFDAYIYIIARNHAFNYLKQVARKRRLEKEWMQSVQPAASTEDNEGQQQPDALAIIESAVALLPPQQQKVYRLGRQEGLSHEQISKQLNISPETVKKHMVLALRSIRAYARKHYRSFLFLVVTALR